MFRHSAGLFFLVYWFLAWQLMVLWQYFDWSWPLATWPGGSPSAVMPCHPGVWGSMPDLPHLFFVLPCWRATMKQFVDEDINTIIGKLKKNCCYSTGTVIPHILEALAQEVDHRYLGVTLDLCFRVRKLRCGVRECEANAWEISALNQNPNQTCLVLPLTVSWLPTN